MKRLFIVAKDGTGKRKKKGKPRKRKVYLGKNVTLKDLIKYIKKLRPKYSSIQKVYIGDRNRKESKEVPQIPQKDLNQDMKLWSRINELRNKLANKDLTDKQRNKLEEKEQVLEQKLEQKLIDASTQYEPEEDYSNEPPVPKPFKYEELSESKYPDIELSESKYPDIEPDPYLHIPRRKGRNKGELSSKEQKMLDKKQKLLDKRQKINITEPEERLLEPIEGMSDWFEQEKTYGNLPLDEAEEEQPEEEEKEGLYSLIQKPVKLSRDEQIEDLIGLSKKSGKPVKEPQEEKVPELIRAEVERLSQESEKPRRELTIDEMKKSIINDYPYKPRRGGDYIRKIMGHNCSGGTIEKIKTCVEKYLEGKSAKEIKSIYHKAQAGKGRKSGNNDYSLYDDQIEKLMKPYKPNFLGVISADEVSKLPYKLMKKLQLTAVIMNLSPSAESGSHWVSVVFNLKNKGKDANSILYYDSFGSQPHPLFLKELKKLALKLDDESYLKIKINRVKAQQENASTCGYHAMNFLKKIFAGQSFIVGSGFQDVIKDKSKEYEKDIRRKIRFGFI